MNEKSIHQFFRNCIDSHRLNESEALDIFEGLLNEPVPPSVLGAFLFALSNYGFSSTLLARGATILLKKGTPLFNKPFYQAMDTCGTGGDYSGTFNVSTTVAFVLAGSGVPIIKHGNKAASGKSGSSDVLAELGVLVDVPPGKTADCFQNEKICFCFAPAFYPFLKNFAPVRRELGFRTLFNYLGPLVNPAGVGFHLLGVSRSCDLDLYADALRLLGKSGVVVCGGGKVDEAVLDASTEIRWIQDGKISKAMLGSNDFGLKPGASAELAIDSAKDSARIVMEVLEGKPGVAMDIVIANAALGLMGFGKVANLAEGVALARKTILEGKALDAFQRLQKFV